LTWLSGLMLRQMIISLDMTGTKLQRKGMFSCGCMLNTTMVRNYKIVVIEGKSMFRMLKNLRTRTILLIFFGGNFLLNLSVKILVFSWKDIGKYDWLEISISVFLFLFLVVSSCLLWHKISTIQGHTKKLFRRFFYLFVIFCLVTTILYGMFSPFSYIASFIVRSLLFGELL
ncbi:MAG: hypothetical protein KAJ40_03090, partial [Alphaproteobacteria bacterium]|nr:hypothetical protein [Alphaproteobacteria bacterium]